MPHILVIEKNLKEQSRIIEVLEANDYQTYAASNSELGLQLAHLRSPSLIICNTNVSTVGGFDILQQLRQGSGTQTLPVILISKTGDRATFRKAMSLGADDFLTQPFTNQELLEAVEARFQRTESFTTRIEKLEASLDALNNRDKLTRLPNQVKLKHHFALLQKQVSEQRKNLPLCLISIDQLNWFRSTCGSEFSDEVLKGFVNRLNQLQTEVDQSLFFAFLDGEQFAILPVLGKTLQAVRILENGLLETLSAPLIVHDQEILITVSIASVSMPAETGEIEFQTILGQARHLLQKIKNSGGNQSVTQRLQKKSQESDKFAIATHLLRGLSEEEFHAYYQPQADLKTGQFTGVEALVRWHHREWGVLDPGKFVPVAEETGVILQIDDCVLRLACQAINRWQQRVSEPLTVSVNLSALSFNRPNLSRHIHEILCDYQIDPRWLEFEVTESMLMQDTDKSVKTMQELKSLGVSLAIDDFGIGYSSLSYLQQFPFDTLKIDQCFIQNVDSNTGNASITTAVIQMAHSLNLRVVAEGVERVQERDFLREHNCDIMQGFLISHPVSKSHFEMILMAAQGSHHPVAV